MTHDSIRWLPKVRVDKFTAADEELVRRLLQIDRVEGEHLLRFLDPVAVVEAEGNLLTTAGLARITSLITAGGGQGVTNTAARLGVGNSSTAEAVGQTDLQAAAGSSNRQFQVMDATYPQTSNGVITFRSSFATGEANFAWQEWCVDVGTPTVSAGTTVAALMLNRKVASLGTKASGTWVLTATITLA